MFSAVWKMLKDTVLAFINDEALSRGAAIAFYTVTFIAPVLLIVIAIAGLAFGQDAAQNALTAQLSGLMGQQTAEVLQTAVASASSKSSSVLATMVGYGPEKRALRSARAYTREYTCRDERISTHLPFPDGYRRERDPVSILVPY
jgi:hypothetical protein